MNEHVIVLHGIIRSYRCMKPLANALKQQGYGVLNIDYPSRKKTIEALAEQIYTSISPLCTQDDLRLHFVTHSMGGIITRNLLSMYPELPVKRIVMLGPPNQGSEAADFFKDFPPYRWIYGPAGQQLTTNASKHYPHLPPNIEVGVIAGKLTVDPVCYFLLPRPNDGKVSVQSTNLPNMNDHCVLNTSHSLMMYNPKVIAKTLEFIKKGRFA